MNQQNEQMRPVGRVARRQERNREALIRAASLVMSDKGVDGATMVEIAERADVGAGTVYNYFKSKDDLAQEPSEEPTPDPMTTEGETFYVNLARKALFVDLDKSLISAFTLLISSLIKRFNLGLLETLKTYSLSNVF